MKRTGAISASPDPFLIDCFVGVGRTTLTWSAEGTDCVEVRVGAPDGALFSRGRASGQAETGDWVSHGMVFYLQDVAGSRPLTAENTLATLAVRASVAPTVHPELARLRLLPRFQPAVTEILGTPCEMVDADSFLHMYYRIFIQQIYAFHVRYERPTIIDGGANIGVFVLYCKKLYPASEIIAFEADRDLCAVLQRNIERGGHRDVTVICAAVASADQPLAFRRDGALAGRIPVAGDSPDTVVPAVRLRPYLERPVDLLKLSIEGAETGVLLDCEDLLGNVENIALRYHSFAGEKQTLHVLLSILANAGFRVHIKQFGSSPHPLIERELHNGEDLQLRVFAFRQ